MNEYSLSVDWKTSIYLKDNVSMSIENAFISWLITWDDKTIADNLSF